jgi:hypothetical protein
MDWLSLNKGCGRFLNPLDGPPEKSLFYIFFSVNANPTSIVFVIGVELDTIILLPIGQGSRPLLPIG